MSSARISAHKGGIEVLPSTAAAHRASDAADPIADFATALGAMTASFRLSSGHLSHGGSKDASADGAHAGTDPTDAPAPGSTNAPGSAADPTADAGDAAGIVTLSALTSEGPTKPAAATGGDAGTTPAATLPRLTGWLSGAGHRPAGNAQTPADQRQPVAVAADIIATSGAIAALSAPAAGDASAPSAPVADGVTAPADAETGAPASSVGAVGAAAVAVATSVVDPVPQYAAAASSAPPPVVRQPAAAPIELAQPDAAAPVPATTPPAGRPRVASIAIAPAGETLTAAPADPTIPAIPAMADGTGLRAATPAGSPAPSGVADQSAALLAQAANPSPVVTVDAAAPAAAAMVSPVAPFAGGSGTRDFADTARDGQAAAAAAFSGVDAASAGTATAGPASSPGAGTAPGPGLATDAGAANVATQLSGQVLRLLSSSGHEAMVRLYPPDLGEVTVRVAISGRDVSAWFGSPQPGVQQSISAGLGQLQTDLGNAGYSLNNAWVGADASGFGARGDTPPPPAPIATMTPAVPATPVAAALSSNSGVSIYV